MDTQRFNQFITYTGWLVFLISGITYTLTIEATTSLWDCGEFIASSWKQQVVHPPGASTFLMISRMFTLLAAGDPQLIGLTINFMSGLCSAFAMMFLCWVTIHLARKLITPDNATDNQYTAGQAWTILGAGLIAGLGGTFTDSIWFSAVEGEVYSMSLMFTAMVVWAACKWDARADKPSADNWLLFIGFIIGVTLFVHWLNILAIPAITMVYYFRRYKLTWPGAITAFIIGNVLLGFILSGIIQGVVSVGAAFELFLVNGMGMPFNSGVWLYLVLLIGVMAFGLWWSHKNKKILVNSALLFAMFVLIGYSSIITIVIRANANTNINMNTPSDIVSLDAYLKREQYGSRPLLTGYDFTAKVVDTKKTGTKYFKGEKRYEDVGDKIEYVFDGKKMFFPRIYSTESDHRRLYERWLDLKPGEKPTTADNWKFFFKYQIGHMYVRYLLWNFVGRQNDEQGMGDIRDGNWLSGIGFVDSAFLGPQSNLPEAIKNHPSRNTMFFIPLLIALLGAIFQFMSNKRYFGVVTLLFLYLGVMIIIQGNSPPVEPRERDYIFAGSFWAFNIWLGLGVVAIFDMLGGLLKNQQARSILAIGIAALAPLLMGAQNWNNHDRSNRFAARDFAANYLNSCAPNSIIFTQGDNDTYPLWYAQEVEGIRRDVRVVNLSLLGVDWYIDQLRRKVNDADPVPMTLTPEKYRGTERDIVPFVAKQDIPADAYVSLDNVMKFITSESSSAKVTGSGRPMNYLPTKRIKMPVDREAVLASGAISPNDVPLMEPEIQWEITKDNLYKNDLLVLDIVNANNWKRPIYFAISVSPSSYLGLEKYFQLEGLAYRIVPVEAKGVEPYTGKVNPDIMYQNMMSNFKFGNIKNPDVLVDADLTRMVHNFRGNSARLAEAFIDRGQKDKAAEVLNRAMTEMPDSAVPFNMYLFPIISAYYETDDMENANAITDRTTDRIAQDIAYYKSLKGKYAAMYKRELDSSENLMRVIIRMLTEKQQTEMANKVQAKLDAIGK